MDEHHTPSESRSGLFWVISIILFCVTGALLSLGFARYIKSHSTPSRNPCIANLKQIDGAQQQWALENNKLDTDKYDPAGVATYLKGGRMLTCPDGGSYALGINVSSPPTCTLAKTLGHSLP